MLPPELLVQLACIWEATARKPGNVHRYRDFADTSYVDFLASAAAAAPWLGTADARPLGETVYEAVRASRRVVSANTNLGIILLLAPLAKAAAGTDLRARVDEVLAAADVEDSRRIYAAIRLANPGGLGRVADQDVAGEPTLPLQAVMRLAADRDLIARQYAAGFREVFEDGLSALAEALTIAGSIEGGIIGCQLRLLARYPDSLIRRKCGESVAEEASRRALQVVQSGWPRQGRQELADLDRWLRADGNRRNPGTTADLVTACLFVALWQGLIPLPLSVPWAADELPPVRP